MAYIDLTRRSLQDPHQNTLCLTKEECIVLLPFFRKAQEGVTKKWEKYKDIHETGEATTRQQTLMFKYEDEKEKLDGTVELIEDWTKNYYIKKGALKLRSFSIQ
jgi:hypothetical protein